MKEYKKLMRSNNEVLNGVITGFAKFAGFDVTLMRIVFFIVLISNPILTGFLYFIAVHVMAKYDSEFDISNQEQKID